LRSELGALLVIVALCSAGVSTSGDPFTDGDLEELLARNERGVIYLWSPHMPFSVDGVEAISAAAGARDIEVTILLHPGSDADFSRREAERASIPESGLRVVSAAVLVERGMTNHAPSIQLYAEGELVGPVLPGVRSVAGYLEFIDSLAQAAAR